MNTAETISLINALHYSRRHYHSAEKRTILQMKGICRATADGSKTEGTALFNRIVKNADDLTGAERDLKEIILAPLLVSYDTMNTARKAAEKQLAATAKELPIWQWAEPLRGIGALGIGQIVGEAGDLNNYANPAKLWKRFGMAVLHGERQRHVANNPKLAIEHGYVARRRAVLFVIEDSIIKSRGDYRHYYDDRKIYEKERNPEMSDGHAHRRAQRFMGKRLLRDLWNAWREF